MKLFFLLISLVLFSCSSIKMKGEMSYDAELTEFEYPFEVKTYLLKSQRQELNMRYMDVGNKDSKKVAVLLHGKNFSGYYWEKIANDLIKDGYRVIIPDQIGFGKSSKPKNYQFSFSQLSHNTISLLESLSINKFVVIGHSMGGMLATHMTYLHPDMVSRLILINPIGLEVYLDFVEYKSPDFFYELELNKTVDKIRSYQMKNYYDGVWGEEYEKLLQPFKGWLNGESWPTVAWNNALTYGPIFTEEIVSKLQKLTTPTYLIIGTRDRTGPGRNWKRSSVKRKLGDYSRLGKYVARSNRRIRLFELSGLGHMPHFENYKRFKVVFDKSLP